MMYKRILLTLAIVALLLNVSALTTADILKTQDSALTDRENDVIKYDLFSEEDYRYNQARPNIDIKKIEWEKNGKIVNLSLVVKGQIENKGDINELFNAVSYCINVETNYNSYQIIYVNNEVNISSGRINSYSSEGSRLNISFELNNINEDILMVFVQTMDSPSDYYCYYDFAPNDVYDQSPPDVSFIKPEKGIYMFNKKLMKSFGRMKSIIIGKITIIAQATDDESGIYKVDFYIDNELVKSDYTPPYEYEWKERSFGRHSIKIVAYDNADNQASRELTVIKIL